MHKSERDHRIFEKMPKKVTPPLRDKLCKLKDIIGANGKICYSHIAVDMDIE